MADSDVNDSTGDVDSVAAAAPVACTETAEDGASLSVSVDKFVWKYMEKSLRFSADVNELIKRAASVNVEEQAADDRTTSVVFTADDRDILAGIESGINGLIARCNETVQTVVVPKQEALVHSKIVENADSLGQSISGQVFVVGDDIVVTGTKEEIETSLGMLEELYGLTRGDKDSSGGPNSLQLWRVGSIDPVSVEVDTGLWLYVNKPDGRWADELKQLRGNGNVQIAETASGENGGTTTRIDLTGMKDSVAETKEGLQRLIDSCSRDVKTARSGKLDEKVFAKASKFLHVLNKTGAIATAVDCHISVTGTDAEVKACREKLDKLNVTLSDTQKQSPAPVPAPSAAAAAGSASKADVASEEPKPRSAAGSKPAAATSNAAGGSGGGSVTSSRSGPVAPPAAASTAVSSATSGDRVFLEVPFPIEEQLWSFMQKRRSALLKELREVYMVDLSSYPAGEPGYVMIHMSAESNDMLECAQESFMQLLQLLHQTVVVQVLETESGGRSLPPEMNQLFNQLITGIDATVNVVGGRIVITGPRDAAVECQQRIASFVQQQQQMQGGSGGFGGSMGMARPPQGMGMGMGGDPGFGGGTRLGGRSVMDTTNEDDMQTTVRNQRNALFGNQGRERSNGFAAGQGTFDGDERGSMGGGGGFSGDFGRSSSSGSQSFDRPGVQIREIVDDDDDDAELERATCGRSGSDGGAAVNRRQLEAPRDGGAGASRGGLAAGSSSLKSGQRESTGGGRPHVRFADEQEHVQSGSVTSSSSSAAANVGAAPRAASTKETTTPTETTTAAAATTKTTTHVSNCSVCQLSGHGSSAAGGGTDSGRCTHSFCVACVKEYFSAGSLASPSCPVCGSDHEAAAGGRQRTQPTDGRMLVTHDSSFRLPGFENKSRGTITVIYSFPSGIQKDHQPNPGQRYSAVTRTAFFPLSPEGSTLVDQLQRAFDDGLVFAMVPRVKGQPDEIDWNGLDHKTNIFGGPQLQGYPDAVYLQRLQNQLKAKGIH